MRFLLQVCLVSVFFLSRGDHFEIKRDTADGYHCAVFGITRRGHQMLLYRGHRYVREKQKGDISNWKCSMHSKYQCKARAVTRKRNGREMMRLTHVKHTHEIFPENVGKMKY
uniref:FLYWCH-type domain-containing protein n=1 Tax=Anopheles christyi TaxID=43041 RepID=A0A182JNK6_9DIPT